MSIVVFADLDEPSNNDDRPMVGREGSKHGKCGTGVRSLDNKRPQQVRGRDVETKGLRSSTQKNYVYGNRRAVERGGGKLPERVSRMCQWAIGKFQQLQAAVMCARVQRSTFNVARTINNQLRNCISIMCVRAVLQFSASRALKRCEMPRCELVDGFNVIHRHKSHSSRRSPHELSDQHVCKAHSWLSERVCL